MVEERSRKNQSKVCCAVNKTMWCRYCTASPHHDAHLTDMDCLIITHPGNSPSTLATYSFLTCLVLICVSISRALAGFLPNISSPEVSLSSLNTMDTLFACANLVKCHASANLGIILYDVSHPHSQFGYYLADCKRFSFFDQTGLGPIILVGKCRKAKIKLFI